MVRLLIGQLAAAGRRLLGLSQTVRLRLTLLYGGLFLAAGGVLVLITYLLMRRSTQEALIARWRKAGGNGEVILKSGSEYLKVAGHLTAQQLREAQQLYSQLLQQRATDLHQLLVQSGIALAITAVLAIFFGWLAAGRVLRPLRTMNAKARRISEHNLHERLAIAGPNSELKGLADTFDDLLSRLETAFQAQRRFIANASHELRTPLTLQRTLLELALADRHATADSLRATCQELLTAEEEQESLIEALLTLASSERGLDRHEVFDLAAVTESVLGARQSESDERDVHLEAELGSAQGSGSPILVERLVANVVDNALRHNLSGGQARVQTVTRDGRATLLVENTGPTVPPEELERLVEPFRRLQIDRTGDGNGHGLGLSIVRAIADAHGATFTVEPQSEGGLKVEVVFPAPSERAG